MTSRCAATTRLVLALAAAVRVAAAQSPDTTACRGTLERKAVVGRVVGVPTGAPKRGVYALLTAQRSDTTYYSDGSGFFVVPGHVQIIKLDASGRVCFRNLASGDYRFEVKASSYNSSHQAIIVHLGSADTLSAVTLRYRPFGNSPEEELSAANLLSALDGNRRRWLQQRPPHYLLRVKRDCFCFIGPPPTYEVRDGVAIAAIDSAGVRHAVAGEPGVKTIDELFDALRGSIRDESLVVDAIKYDQRFGWPSHFETDLKTPGVTDSWEKVTVERFDVIE